MSTTSQSSLELVADWVRQTDDHVEYRLVLLDQVERALSRPDESDREESRRLAHKLERWRYQQLRDNARSRSPQEEALVDALDQAANVLSGCDRRPPRSARRAIYDTALETGSIQQAIAALESHRPVDLVAMEAADLTAQNFAAPSSPGQSAAARRRMLLYAPLYLSNECVNYCTYCGFRFPRRIVRQHLTVDDAVDQGRILRRRGFQHVVVVAGEFPSRTTTTYFGQLVARLVTLGIDPSIEIAPQSSESYAELLLAGTGGLTLYQETYDPHRYAQYHPRGPKASFMWRLEAPERAAEVGVRRLGLGVLLGLSDPVQDVRALMRHGAYLADRFPACRLAFSLPRIHDAPAGFRSPHRVDDEQLIRLYCILRLAFPRAQLVLSTRESVALRNRLTKICITQMSAGSSTAPGGYEPAERPNDEQFPVADRRTPAQVVAWLRAEGFEPSWRVA